MSRILLNVIAGVAIRIDPDIENMTTAGGVKKSHKNAASNKVQYTRYFKRAYGTEHPTFFALINATPVSLCRK